MFTAPYARLSTIFVSRIRATAYLVAALPLCVNPRYLFFPRSIFIKSHYFYLIPAAPLGLIKSLVYPFEQILFTAAEGGNSETGG